MYDPVVIAADWLKNAPLKGVGLGHPQTSKFQNFHKIFKISKISKKNSKFKKFQNSKNFKIFITLVVTM
jgi:hypothetical protein